MDEVGNRSIKLLKLHHAPLTKLQRLVMAALEEAGQDDLCALTNTVQKCHGDFREIDRMASSLVTLLEQNLIQVSKVRHVVPLHFTPLAASESLALFRDLRQFFQWSTEDQLWKWPQKQARAEIILTDLGFAVAKQILSEDGWPF